MIRLEFARIVEFRDIRKLELDFGCQPFAICGPNGSGKSGVVDAIEFGLTGQIGRLVGSGSKGLSVKEHGPHVDESPEAALVELGLFLPSLGKSVTITRRVKSPKSPKLVPADDDIRVLLDEIAKHPEVALSRREIIRFILAEPTKRSEGVQSLLKLNGIGRTRSALYAAQNKLQAVHRTATSQVDSCREALQRQLQVQTVKDEEILRVVNEKRELLALPLLAHLRGDASLDAGLPDAVRAGEPDRESALRDLRALSGSLQAFPELVNPERTAILAGLERLDADPSLLVALQR